MPVAEARAIEPSLHVEQYEPDADLMALGRLAEWASRFSPIVAMEGGGQRAESGGPSKHSKRHLALRSPLSALSHSLLLDITGCAACFGGEEKLLEQAVREFREQEWNARVAIADTVGGAWGLAHYGQTPQLVPPGETEAALWPLTVAALRLPNETVSCLAELGIERIGELAALPRSSVPARLGPAVLDRLDQALGRLPEVLVPHRPPPPIEAAVAFEYATDQRDAIDYVLGQLAARVCRLLDERSAGARQVECWLHHEVARPQRLEVGLYRPSRSPTHLRMLFRTRFEHVAIDEPVCAISLRVPVVVPLDAAQCEIFDTETARDDGEWARFVDELSTRLGRDAVTRPRLVADAQPEHACCYEPVVERVDSRGSIVEGRKTRIPSRENSTESQVSGSRFSLFNSGTPELGSSQSSSGSRLSTLDSRRPLQLLPQPVPIPTTSVVPDGPPMRFRWGGVEHTIARSWGPERIETGWWRGQDVHRDYYLVETHSGARFWIYRRRDDGRWFLHGCFD
jgi:protein ImuB